MYALNISVSWVEKLAVLTNQGLTVYSLNIVAESVVTSEVTAVPPVSYVADPSVVLVNLTKA